MAIGDAAGKARDQLRKAVVPGAASVVGAGAGLLLTRKNRNFRAALPDLKDIGVGDIADDLRGRLESVLGKTSEPGRSATNSSHERRTLDGNELATRRQEREERRSRRRQHSQA
jgi:hypothetical protein